MLQTKYSVYVGIIKLSNDVIAGKMINHDCGLSPEVVIENNAIKLRLYEDAGEDRRG